MSERAPFVPDEDDLFVLDYSGRIPTADEFRRWDRTLRRLHDAGLLGCDEPVVMIPREWVH